MIERIVESMRRFSDRNAMFIRERFYTYAELAQQVSDIKSVVVPALPAMPVKYVGVVVREDLASYASCLAVMLSSCGYVPLSAQAPIARNLDMVEQTDLRLIFTTDPEADRALARDGLVQLVDPRALPRGPIDLTFPAGTPEDPAYVIFTSGSTGKPKGAPISRANLDAFLDSMHRFGWKIDETDGFLQMSSMTFDMSILSFVIPLSVGACVYSVPEEEIKYLYGMRLMQAQPITIMAVVPSTLSLLERYFDEIRLPLVRYALVCGEAFPLPLAAAFQHCIPDGEILNCYGPTEATVLSHIYRYAPGQNEKGHNGIMALGALLANQGLVLLDEHGEEVATGSRGEGCLYGPQITLGYLANPQKNAESFFVREHSGAERRFYRTGDLLFADEDGCYFYVGRLDHQVKIDGHRVELGEIEAHLRAFQKSDRVAVVAYKTAIGTQQLHAFAEGGEPGTPDAIKSYLRDKLPYYMVPTRYTFVKALPLNSNGKIDRPALVRLAQR